MIYRHDNSHTVMASDFRGLVWFKARSIISLSINQMAEVSMHKHNILFIGLDTHKAFDEVA